MDIRKTVEQLVAAGASEEEIDVVIQAYGKEQGPKTTGLGAAAAGLGQGALFGFGDEAAAGAGAAYDYFTGQGDFSSSYDKRVKEQRKYLESAAKENPGWYYGGMIGGAVGVPFSAPGRLATMGATRLAGTLAPRAGNLGRSATVGAIEGAGYGALSGAGMSEGGLQSRAEGAVGGGLTGGAIGGAAPVAIQLATSGIREGVNRVRDITTPQAAATRDVARGLMAADDMRPDVQNILNRGLADDPLLRVDASERTRALARRAANLSPEARATLDNTINPRFEQQVARATDFMRRQTPGLTGDADEIAANLRRQAQAANRPAYERSFAQGDRPLNSPLLERLQSAPEFRKAMQEAVPEYQNRAVLDGYQGFNARVRVTDDGQIVFNRGPEGPAAYPNLAYWDTVKRVLDKQGELNLRQTGSRGTAGQMARELRNELDQMVPSYQQTRSQAAAFFGAEDAVDAARNLVRGGVRGDPRAMLKAFNQMSPAEQRVFRQSYANALMDSMYNIKDRQDLVKRFGQSPTQRAQLELGLGRQRAREFEAYLYLEEIADRARTALQGNSTTARQLMEMGGAGVASGSLFGGGDPTSPDFWRSFFMGAGAAWGARRLNATVAERWAQQVATLLTQRDNPQALQRALNNIARNDRFIDGLRRVTSRMAAPAGGIAGGAVGAQSPMQVEITRGDVERNR